MLTSNTDVKYIKGVGEKRARLLNKLGIDSVGALLSFYPRGYRDLTVTTPIYDTLLEEKACIKARIITPITEHYIRQNMVLYKFAAADESGSINITLFNTKFLAAKLHRGSSYIFCGKISGGVFAREMSSPEIYEENNNGLLPIYRLTDGISGNYLSTIIKNALSSYDFAETLPQSVIKENGLCDIKTALFGIHFPTSAKVLEKAKKRLVFEELFLLQCSMQYLKIKRRGKTAAAQREDFTGEFLSFLPFNPTSAQLRAIKESVSDMRKNVPMNRLVQGDVGSGKTLVAAAACYNAARNGYQSLLMAPTVILAEQHYATFNSFFGDKIRCALLTGAKTAAQKRRLHDGIANDEYDVIIGTSALITDAAEYKNVGLVITDEQHRFGVQQRLKLGEKGECAHTLVMSATPIPRTLSMVIYGDMDVSIIDEYPAGRQKIDTYCITADIRKRAYNYIKKHLDEGRQGYIICPLVEDGESGRLSAESCYEKLKDTFFKRYSLGLLHGKMKAAQKEKIMRSFKAGEIQLLISTTVIEVGIDVPNATILVIENAECFGLSQLHQLRGRIGRGQYKSTCVLISDTSHNNDRLKAIASISDGFKLAEEDLKLRGPGDFIGNRQHGLPEMKIADIFADYEVLKLTKAQAQQLLEADEDLTAKENAAVKAAVRELFRKI